MGGGKPGTHSSVLTAASAYSPKSTGPAKTNFCLTFSSAIWIPLRRCRGIPSNSWNGLARTSSVSGWGMWTRMTRTDSWQSPMQSRNTAARGFCSTCGLPHPNGYEIDHFLGNLRLMRLGLQLFQENPHRMHENERNWQAEMRDPLQTIHFVVSDVTLERKNEGVQRVSLISEEANVTVENSVNLRWSLRRTACGSD